MSRINNYEELLVERKRLENLILEQKQEMKAEFSTIKGKLEPFLNLLPMLNVFKEKEKSRPLLSTISSLGIDLVGQTVLSKANWVTKFIVPLIAKGITSGIFRKNKVQTSTHEVT